MYHTCDRRLLVVAHSDWQLYIPDRVLRELDRMNFEPPLTIEGGKEKKKKILQGISASISSHEGIRKEFSILILVNFFWFC